jgi:hypothetical protein
MHHRRSHSAVGEDQGGPAQRRRTSRHDRGIAAMRSRGPAQLRSGRRGDGCPEPTVARQWQPEPRSAGTGQAVAPTRNAPRRAFRRRHPARSCIARPGQRSKAFRTSHGAPSRSIARQCAAGFEPIGTAEDAGVPFWPKTLPHSFSISATHACNRAGHSISCSQPRDP